MNHELNRRGFNNAALLAIPALYNTLKKGSILSHPGRRAAELTITKPNEIVLAAAKTIHAGLEIFDNNIIPYTPNPNDPGNFDAATTIHSIGFSIASVKNPDLSIHKNADTRIAAASSLKAFFVLAALATKPNLSLVKDSDAYNAIVLSHNYEAANILASAASSQKEALNHINLWLHTMGVPQNEGVTLWGFGATQGITTNQVSGVKGTDTPEGFANPISLNSLNRLYTLLFTRPDIIVDRTFNNPELHWGVANTTTNRARYYECLGKVVPLLNDPESVQFSYLKKAAVDYPDMKLFVKPGRLYPFDNDAGMCVYKQQMFTISLFADEEYGYENFGGVLLEGIRTLAS